MALRSERQDSKVDPDKGVYVEMEGIMEVRFSSEDVDYEDTPEDFMSFQARVREIPDDFCPKNKETTEQAYLYCQQRAVAMGRTKQTARKSSKELSRPSV